MADRLYRSREDRMLAGVAGGLADLWDADPAVIRIVWALLAFFTGGIFLVVYIVMAIVVPDEPYTTPSSSIVADPVTGASVASAPLVDPRSARREARAARRASETGSGLGTAPIGILVGGILVALGAFFLIREYLPEIDFDWFWPVVLIILGAVLILGTTARGRGRGGGGSSTTSESTGTRDSDGA